MISYTVNEGSATFLQQAYRNNWQQYLASLQADGPGGAGGTLGWDVCVLTASDERQAGMYRRQVESRREAGLLPAHTRFEVIADPDGRRIGSGGATLRVLFKLFGQQTGALAVPASTGKRPAMRDMRVLIIHSGGDSRRMPHCSAAGKLFARVPHELPDGRAATIFDEFLVNLSGLTASLRPGVLIASGDVVLVFDHLQLAFQRPGAIGVAAAAPIELGLDHGVYVPGADGHSVKAYLHKPDVAALATCDAIRDDAVQIDTGLVWLDMDTAVRYSRLMDADEVARLCGDASTLRTSGGLNFYGDLLLPLAQSTIHAAYLADASDGPCTEPVQAARRVIWERMRGTPFTCQRLQPAVFLHFGSTEEYWRTASDATLRRICNWVPTAAAWSAPQSEEVAPQLSLMDAAVEAMVKPGAAPAVIIDSRLAGALEWEAGCLISGLRSELPLQLDANIAISQLPIAANGADSTGWVTRVYGLRDNPKQHWADPAATFVNQPWHAWLNDAAIDPADLWPGVPGHERSLWNARLFPLLPGREDSLRLALPLQFPAIAPDGWRDAWLHAERLSLAESFQRADAGRLLADIGANEDTVAVRRFMAAVELGQSAATAKRWLGKHPATVLRRVEQVSQELLQRDPLLQIRAYKALAVACGSIEHEDRAFAIMADIIGKSVIAERQSPSRARTGQLLVASAPVRVECAARIDFGGGWTDTPPYSIERGGCVLNAAVTLRGAYPIVAEAAFLAEPRLILESKDIDARYEPQVAGDILSYADRTVVDPFALLKAALVVCDVIPADCDPNLPIHDLMAGFGAGLALSTQTSIPRGSGLGTSSILAGAVLEALHRLLGGDEEEGRRGEKETGRRSADSPPHLLPSSPQLLFSEVLWLEQLLTTGGGWQDQVGGLTGGIKLVTSEPGLPQRMCVQPVVMPHHAQIELAERLVLVYTGQQRLAKNLLHAIMARWMGRDTDMTWMLGEIARLALAMREALAGGDLDGFGWLLAEHWSINKRMDPGCSNPFIDGLFDAMQPFICGGKLTGAGGGGFALVLAKDSQSARDLRSVLALRFRGTPVGVWDCEIPPIAIASL